MVYHENTDELAYAAVSVDSITWSALKREPLLIPGSGNQRNPSLLRWNNCYYLAHTNSTNTYFTILKSYDLRTWTSVVNVSMTSIGSLNLTEAPKWFIDDDGTVRIFVAASTGGSTTNYQIYELHATATDLSTWSNPTILTGTSLRSNMKYPHCVKVGSTYNVWYQDGSTNDIEYMSSTSLTSGYTKTQTGVWTSIPTGRRLPFLIQIDSSTWRIFFEENSSNNSVNLWYAESTDNWATFGTPVVVTTPYTFASPALLRVQDFPTLRNMFGMYATSHRGRGVRVNRNTNQATTNATGVAVQFPNVDKDDLGAWSSGTNTRLTAPFAGWYIIGCNVNWAATSAGSRIMDFRANGSNFFSGSERTPANATEPAPGHNLVTSYYLNRNDYVEVIVFQSCGTNLNVTASNFWMMPQ